MAVRWRFGFNSAGTDGYFNDLWKYSAGEWTWMSGSNGVSQDGTYGTQGIAAAGQHSRGASGCG